MTDPVNIPTFTQEELDAIYRLRAGTHVLVPQSALDWLFGTGSDKNGYWFNHHEATTEIEAVRRGWPTPKYWWRSVFRALLKAAQV